MASEESAAVPKEFKRRRLHSFMGLWFCLFLCEHLLVNSQSALWLGHDGHGFVELVNKIHNLPFLPAIEITLLGLPILYHVVFGIKYLLQAHPNSMASSGTKPALGEYSRNHRYTWQRITSWILLVAVVWHVYDMRFANYPVHSGHVKSSSYMVDVSFDTGLYTVADRLDVKLYNQARIDDFYNKWKDRDIVKLEEQARSTRGKILSGLQEKVASRLFEERQDYDLAHALKSFDLQTGHVVALADNFGTAVLLTVRDTFKNPWMVSLYTIFVLSACYHGFNGLWTFCITWGISLTQRAQRLMTFASLGLFLLFSFLGLASVWLTYAHNLYH